MSALNRTFLWILGAAVFAAVVWYFSNIIAYGMSLIKVSDRTFRGWRWIFIIEGLLTVVLAFVAYFLILDFPDKAAEKGFLTIQERDMILTRIERDRGDSKPDALTWAKARKYALDIKCWLYGLMFMCTTMPTYAFAYFLPVILRGLGYTVKDAFLLGAALVRVAVPLLWPAGLLMAVHLSATLWVLAFVAYLARYVGILSRPRLDGKPG